MSPAPDPQLRRFTRAEREAIVARERHWAEVHPEWVAFGDVEAAIRHELGCALGRLDHREEPAAYVIVSGFASGRNRRLARREIRVCAAHGEGFAHQHGLGLPPEEP
jgi:hypothetical protein